MKHLAGIVLVLILSFNVCPAFASEGNGEQEIQRIEHSLNNTLALPRTEQIRVIEQYTSEILELVSKKQITPERAEFALAFINRLV